MDFNKPSFGTPLSCVIQEGASPVSRNLPPASTSPTMKKPRTFTPFSIIDIMKPDNYSPDESVASTDSDSDALHIDLDRSSDEEQYAVQNDIFTSPADGTTRSPADDATRSPADDATRSPADDATRSPADDATRSPADDGETTSDVIPAQGVSPAMGGTGTCSNYPIYQGLANPMNTAYQGIPLPQSVNNLYPIYPVSGVFPPAYPMFIPPATSLIPEEHLNSCHDPENDVPRASPTSTGRVSPTGSSSSGEICSPSPDTSPVTPSSPTTKKTRKTAGGRTCYSQKQVRAMEQVFSENKYPDYDVIEQLSIDTGIPTKRIKVWFQNKRARRKCRAPETQHPNAPHMAAMMSSSPGFNYLSPMMPQLHYPVMSPFPAFPVYPSTVC